MKDDTITAIASARGNGALGIIRIDGPEAQGIAEKLIRGLKVTALKANRMTLAFVVDDDGERIDEVMLGKYVAPHSYTGNDLIEINCHGGMFIMNRILERILNCGARLAEPGEFTQRAFINGKMDLIQAEAVADLIQSKTEQSRKSSLALLKGQLSEHLQALRERLKRIIMLMEIDLDFAEDDIEVESFENLHSAIAAVTEQVRQLILSYSTGKILRDGARIVLIGRPNVGKSSLLNRLLKQDRVIVTDIPGTTRDSIEENIDINGVLFRIVDTAGIRKSTDNIEQAGVQRTFELMQSADILGIILDGSEALKDEDLEIFQELPRYTNAHKIYIRNKSDLEQRIDLAELPIQADDIIKISSKTGENIGQLEAAFYQAVIRPDARISEGLTITRQRHKNCLQQAEAHLQLALESMARHYSYEFVSSDLRAALSDMAELVGAVSSDDILQQIFSEFCIGK